MDFYKLDLSNFIFQEKISVGSQSSCFLAIEKGTKQKCAALVSRFSSSENSLIIGRILGQIKIRFKINCPTIPKFIGYNMNNSNRYINSIIITEFIPNGTLNHIITMNQKQCSDLNWTETKKLINIYGIAFGMSYLHSLDIIHRDLATKNILLDEFLYPKIIDFALALDLNDKGKITEKDKNFDVEKDVKIEINENTKKEINEPNDDKNDEIDNNEKFKELNNNDDKSIKTNCNKKINDDKENDLDDDDNNKGTKIEINDKLSENSKDFNDDKNFNEKFEEEQDRQKLFDDIDVIHIDDNKDSLVGTPSYMAPEIWEEMRYSKSSDVFAFSIVLYEILTSEFPYKTETDQQLSSFIKEGGRPDIENKGIPKCFVDLLKKCWDPKPEKRPTFEEIVTQLKTNKEFITELSIDEEEFLNYQKLIEEKIDEKHNNNPETEIKDSTTDNDENNTNKVEGISNDLSTDADENNTNKAERISNRLSANVDENNTNKAEGISNNLSTDDKENNTNKAEGIYSDVSTDIDENNYNDLETKIKDLSTIVGVTSTEKLERKNKDLSIDVDEIDLSNYKLDEHIDQGSFSNVYKIIDTNTNDIYAAKISLKTIDDYTDLQMISFAREITILSKLKFPSIIKFIGYNKKNFKNQSKPTIITEFVKNQSLEEMIIFNDNNIWNETKKLITIYGIASAMSYMHSLNFIHRDLKPENIFLDEFLYPKIGGFGLSKEIEKDKENVDENENVGTLLYMAPEVITKNIYYKASDVYSFALIVYYIVTIKQPYEGFKSIDIIEKVPEGIRPELNSCTPNCYKELIEKCWSNDYNERPTFDDIIHTLKTNQEFITENVDKDEFFNYIEYIESESNDKSFHQVSFDIEHFKELKHNEELEEIKSSIKEPFLDLNNYEKGSLIVKDENSKIFEIKNKETGVLYAAKISNTKLLANDVINISNEINVISKMNHSTILKFIGFSLIDFKSSQKSVIVSEIPPSNNLSQILDKERNNEKIDGWNDTQKLICLYGISLGMSYMHSNGIIHRNLSTKSVFLDENLFPKIGNFGLLTKFHDLTNQTMINLDENLLISSPELLLSNEYSKSCDVYSFSLIVFELMTLKKPFKNIKNLKELIDEVVTNSNRPELCDSIPESYLKLIKDCWCKNPSNRPTFDQIALMLKSDTGFITEKVNKEVFENYVKSADHEEEFNKKADVGSVAIDEEKDCNETKERIEKVNHNEDDTHENKITEEETEIDKKEESKNESISIEKEEETTGENDTKNEEEINKDDINKADGVVKKRRNRRKKRKNTEKIEEIKSKESIENPKSMESVESIEEIKNKVSIENLKNMESVESIEEIKNKENKENIEDQKNYLEIEDENNNYKEKLRRLKAADENDEKVLKISFKISAINSMHYEASDSDIDNEEKNDNNNENEKDDQILSKSKRPSKRRKKGRKLRKKQKTDQDDIEEDRNSKNEIEIIENEEERLKKEKIRKEDEVRPKKRKIANVGTEEEEEKFNNEEEWLKNKIEELFNDDDDDDEIELNFGNKKEEEDDDEIRIDKIGERLRKENEERLKKEKEEKLKKEEERIKKENEEKLRKEKEDENKKEKDELFRKEVERLKKENEERLKKEEERIKKEKEEKLRKEKEEKLKKEKEEKIKREKEEKARKEKEEKLRKEKEEKIKREKEEKIKRENEEKARKENEERLRKEEEKRKKEEEERIKKAEEANKLIKGKDDNNTAYAKILSKYKNVNDVVIMQLDSSQSESHSSRTPSDSIPKPNFQLGSSSNKSPRRTNESSSSSEINSKKFNTPPSQKVKSSPDHQKSLIHSNSIKLTVTLKDIGMGEFETHDHEIQEPKEKNEGQNSPSSPRRNQTKLFQNSQLNDKELPKLNNLSKHSNQSQISSNSQSQTENKLPKLLNNHPNISIQNDQNQFNPNKIIRSPRRNREKSSNYDPSIFYSPPSKTNTYQNKPVAVDQLIKSPIKLKVTLKDIGMEGFDSSTPKKTQKSQECENQSDQKDDERPRSRRYQRPA